MTKKGKAVKALKAGEHLLFELNFFCYFEEGYNVQSKQVCSDAWTECEKNKVMLV